MRKKSSKKIISSSKCRAWTNAYLQYVQEKVKWLRLYVALIGRRLRLEDLSAGRKACALRSAFV
jgi:hypothetical protein